MTIMKGWWNRKRLLVALVVLLVCWGGTRSVVAFVARRSNPVTERGPHKVSSRAVGLHHRLRVVDMHADTLLWGRDLLKRSSSGQVDVPRLLAGNVGVQAFTVVTQVPRGQNINRTSGNSDLIGVLAFMEHWPPRTWNNLMERALYQAAELRSRRSALGRKAGRHPQPPRT
jgi:membrane dipeptidase